LEDVLGGTFIGSAVFSDAGEVSDVLESLLEYHKAVLQRKLELSHVGAQIEGGCFGLLVPPQEYGIVVSARAVGDGGIVGGYVLVGSFKRIHELLVESMQVFVRQLGKLLP